MAASAISVDSLEKWFPPTHSGWRAFLQPFGAATVPALRGISLEVKQGEAVALLGANGAGKTTLLRILATLLLPTRGSARVAGHDAIREPGAVRRQLGYHAGTDLGFYARLTGKENLRFFGRLNHLSNQYLEKRIRFLGDEFQLGDALDRQVRSLSSGTVQTAEPAAFSLASTQSAPSGRADAQPGRNRRSGVPALPEKRSHLLLTVLLCCSHPIPCRKSNCSPTTLPFFSKARSSPSVHQRRSKPNIQ